MANLVIAKMNKSLTKVFSSVKSGNCTWAALDPVDGLFVAMLIVQNEKSGHSRPLHEKMALDPRSGRRRSPTCHRGGTADDNSRANGELR
jgi:hypothetical protein